MNQSCSDTNYLLNTARDLPCFSSFVDYEWGEGLRYQNLRLQTRDIVQTSSGDQGNLPSDSAWILCIHFKLVSAGFILALNQQQASQPEACKIYNLALLFSSVDWLCEMESTRDSWHQQVYIYRSLVLTESCSLVWIFWIISNHSLLCKNDKFIQLALLGTSCLKT